MCITVTIIINTIMFINNSTLCKGADRLRRARGAAAGGRVAPLRGAGGNIYYFVLYYVVLCYSILGHIMAHYVILGYIMSYCSIMLYFVIIIVYYSILYYINLQLIILNYINLK